MPRHVGRWILGGAAAVGVWRLAAVWGGVPTAPPIMVTRAYVEYADTLHARETFAHVLTRAGLSAPDQVVLLAAATALDARRMRAGQVVHLRRLVNAGTVDRVMLRTSAERRVWLTRQEAGGGWVQTAEEIPWTVAPVVATGIITRTLYDALDSAVADTTLPAGERTALAWALADVYDWEIDFSRDVQPGDHVRVLFERLESPDGERRFGRVLAARVEAGGRPSSAFWFEPDSGRGGYYDDQGRSLRRAFLRAPLEFRRISSRFGGRYHPILKAWRSHRGIDFAADAGTPVRTTADGIVTQAGRNGGLGLMVEVRHANGIRTRYGHLSRLATGIVAGTHVAQRQTIGYVGSTGLATGPHLHYEFLVNGRQTNPQRRHAGSGKPIAPALRAAYEATREELTARLEPPVALAGTAPARSTRVD